MRKLILAALLVGSTATPALAQDANTFSGPRVEALVGYDAVRAADENETLLGSDERTAEGATYGVRAGYDFDLGPAVLGVDAELSGTSAEVENEALGTNVSFGRDLYVGGRLGLKAGSSTLLYAGAGYTNAGVTASFQDLPDADLEGNADGYRLSAGVEQQFSGNTFGRLEYRYSNYGNFEFEDADSGNEIDIDRHQVVASVGFRF